jgi:hypothetical protein
MYASRPPSLQQAADARSGPLRLFRARRRAFDGAAQVARDPEIRVFVSDLIRPYGLAFREDVLRAGSGQSYGEMAETLLRSMVPAGEAVDLLVLAFAIHDVRPGRSTAAYLSHVCPGDPLAFAICDQGAAAAFTGLRLLHEYARTGGCRRSVLVVVEQASLHYAPAAEPAPIPDRHAAVALLFGPTGPAELGPQRQHAGVTPERAGALLAADVAALRAGRSEVILVLGEALARQLAPSPAEQSHVDQLRVAELRVAELRVAPAGQPYTGIWWELACELPRWAAEARLVLLADYDPTIQRLCLSTMDFAGAAADPVPTEPELVPAEQRQPVP